MTAVYLLFPFPSKTTAAPIDDVQCPLRQRQDREEVEGSAIKTERVKVSLPPVIRKRGFHHLNLAVYCRLMARFLSFEKINSFNQSI
jgi:hypothetical protein